MSRRAPGVCSAPFCRRARDEGSEGGYCREHARREPEPRRPRWREDADRGSAHARGYGRRWRRLRDSFLIRHPVCGCGYLATEVDHKTPKADGGSDDWTNLQALCRACHVRKTAAETVRRREAAGAGVSRPR